MLCGIINHFNALSLLRLDMTELSISWNFYPLSPAEHPT